MQLAGNIMQAVFPRLTIAHGLEHVLSIVFEDISKIPVVKVVYFRGLKHTFISVPCHSRFLPQQHVSFLSNLYFRSSVCTAFLGLIQHTNPMPTSMIS